MTLKILLFIVVGILFSGCSTKHLPKKNSSINYQTNQNKDFISYRDLKQSSFFVKTDTGVISGKVDALISTSTGKEIISCSRDKTVRAFDVISGKELRKYLWNITDGAGNCNDIALSHDDRFLVVAVKGSKQLFIYNFQSGKLIKTIRVDSDVKAISISSDNKYITTAHEDKVIVWDYARSKRKKTIDHGAVNLEIIKVQKNYLIIFVDHDENVFLSTLKGKGYVKKKLYVRNAEFQFEMNHISYNKQIREVAIASRANNVVWIFGLKDKIDPINMSEKGIPKVLKGSKMPAWKKHARDLEIPVSRLRLSEFYLDFTKIIRTKTNRISNISYSQDGRYLAVDSWDEGTCEEIYDTYELINGLYNQCQVMWPTTFINNNTLIGIEHETHLFQHWDFTNSQLSFLRKNTIKPKRSVSFNGNYLAWGSKYCKKENSGFFGDGYDENCLDLESAIDLNSLKLTNGIDKAGFRRVSESNNTHEVEFGPGKLYDWNHKLTYQIKNKTTNKNKSFSVDPEDGWVANAFGVTDELIISGNREGHLVGYAITGNKKSIQFVGHTSIIQSISIVGSTLVSSDLSGEILMWKIPSKKEMSEQHHIKVFPLFTFLIDDHGDYIIVSDDGYFAGSYALLDKVWLHINSKSINKQAKHMELNQFYDVFYRPDIVLARLQRLDNITNLKPVSMAEAINCPPPEVFKLSIRKKSSSEIGISYTIKDTGGGIGDVRVYINGKLAHIDTNTVTSFADPVEMNQAMASSNISQRLRGLKRVQIKRSNKTELKCNTSTSAKKKSVLTLKTISGKNVIQVAAFNSKNNIQSVLKEAVYQSNTPARKTKVYVLAVGIDQYTNQRLNLHYSAIDAKSIKQLINTQLSGIYNEIEVVSLIDNDATKENIINELDSIKKKAQPSDIFILFVASHGEVADQFYIITHDYAKTDGSFDSSSWMSSKELLDKLQEISAQKQFVMLDTCHSGALNDIVSNFYDARMSTFTHKAGLTMLSSTKASQQAIDNYKGNGLLTHLLKLSFKSKPDKDKSNDISVHEIADEVQNQFGVVESGVKSMQQPSTSKFGLDFIVDKL